MRRKIVLTRQEAPINKLRYHIRLSHRIDHCFTSLTNEGFEASHGVPKIRRAAYTYGCVVWPCSSDMTAIGL